MKNEPVASFTAAPVDGLVAEYHDASRCTIDGRPCWVASVSDVQPNRKGKHILDVSDHPEPEEARRWCQKQIRRRTGKPITKWSCP